MANLYGRGSTPNRSRDFNGRPIGHTTAPRMVGGSSFSLTIVSGSLRLAFFQGIRNETVSKLAVTTGNNAAGATPTLCRMGLYSVDDSGALTLEGSTENDTTLFGSANTRYQRTMDSTVDIRVGLWYAMGLLIVTGAATPSFHGVATGSIGNSGNNFSLSPRISGFINGQTDLPSSLASTDISDGSMVFFGEIDP